MNKRTLLTLEERLDLAARSRAVSPEAAAALVKRFSETGTADFFGGNDNLQLMADLTGEFLNDMGEELLCYRGFCLSFQAAIRHDTDLFEKSQTEASEDAAKACSHRPVYGARVNNALVLLGELLLEHVKGKRQYERIYHCTRMTLEQYLDALTDLSFRKDGTLDLDRAKFYRSWRDSLLTDYDGSLTLEETLTNILRRYIAAWREFDRLDRILCCIGAMACYPMENRESKAFSGPETDSARRFREALLRYGLDLEEQEPVRTVRRYLDPYGHYLARACEYPADIPDPGSPDLECRALRGRIFLSGRDYSPKTLEKLAALVPSADLQALLKQNISGERLSRSMRRLNIAVTDLYMLWVAPYITIGRYHYERHLEGDLLSA